MNVGLRQAVASIKTAFPVSAVYIFGSYARGDQRPDSDLDVLVVCRDRPDDLFDRAYEIRKHLHDRIDLALDVIVTTNDAFKERELQRWTIEHVARAEGIVV